jgi:hypothetical protein
MNYAIVIPSCDKFSDLWPVFFGQFFRYWPEASPIYLVSNHRVYDDPRVHSIRVGDDVSWSQTMATALDQVTCDYVLLILEDFPLMASVDTKRLQAHFELMVREQAGYLRLRAAPEPDQPHLQSLDIGYITPGSAYRTSLQAAFWHRQTLMNLLETGENPWQFELIGSRRSDACIRPFLSVNSTLEPPIPYFPNAVIRGVWAREAVAALAAQQVAIDPRRPIESAWSSWWRKSAVRHWLARAVFIPMKRRLGMPTP